MKVKYCINKSWDIFKIKDISFGSFFLYNGNLYMIPQQIPMHELVSAWDMDNRKYVEFAKDTEVQNLYLPEMIVFN
jgi:hypothetical protein